MNKLFLATVLLLLTGVACNKSKVEDPSVSPDETTLENLNIHPSFGFNTTREVNIGITTLDNADRPIPNISINIYTDYPENNGSQLINGVTNAQGLYAATVNVPAYYDSLVVQTDAVGFVSWQKVKITGNTCTCTLGGKNPTINGRVSNTANNAFTLSNVAFTHQRTESIPFIKPMGPFNSLGVPGYLMSPNEVIDAVLLADINNTLPERKPVPQNSPEYLDPSNMNNLEFTQTTNVVVTFLHEGAGYKNVLGFYKYNLNNPPTAASQIDTIYVIFPNVSYLNSGGGLISGNRVHLGTFQPGTGIGFVLFADGYRNNTITTGNNIFYSNAAFNPETDASRKKHSILLKDVARQNFVLSFEDIRRDQGTDNDFNDAIFLVRVDPVHSVNTTNIPSVKYDAYDTDNDGIGDNFDSYATDPTKSFNNYFPSQNTVGTLAFEDLWPSKGDYDFNDMVLDYRFNLVTNSQNMVVQIVADITLKAIGASFHNGFGFQLPIPSGQVASVSGTDVRSSLISNNPNGTESGQRNATIIVFDNAFDHLRWPGTGIGVNTTPGAPYVQPKTFTVVINLVSPVSMTTLGLPPFNPFIFINKTRSREVHLMHKPPTDLADLSLLGTGSDNSNSATGRYYVTAKNLPFAIDIAGPFDYATEKTVITQAHLKFANWATSGGSTFADWYLPKANYRNEAKIYKR